MSKVLKISITILLLAGSTVLGDWNPNNTANPKESTNHKMHHPQLPDPDGWDVRCTSPIALADDWQCSQAGPVSDIHIWGSWREDQPGVIAEVGVAIFDNIPAGVGGLAYSRPGATVLWERGFTPNQFSLRPYGTGLQGWYDPFLGTGGAFPDDHSFFHQINIENIDDPFFQEDGKTYWLGMMVTLESTDVLEWGWKTSLNHWEDDAVWAEVIDGPNNLDFKELRDPFTNESLDLAFVITPEPATVALLLIGGLTVLRRRRST